MRPVDFTNKTNEGVINDPFTPDAHAPLTNQHSDAANHGFAQKLGIHPGIAVLTVAVDSMLFASDIATAGFIIPLTLAVAFGLGIVTFMAQRKWFGDDVESAFIKAFIVAGLTAIPTSLPGFLTVPAGVVGLFRKGDR